jgi:hypothetical protein
MLTPAQELINDIAGFYYDPYGYVKYAFAWGQNELKGHSGPDKWQEDQLRRIGETIRQNPLATLQEAVASGHGVGKSTEVAWIILWAMSTRPHLAGWVTANTQVQLVKKTWRELSVWHNRAINKNWFSWTATRFYFNAHPQTWGIDAIPWSEHNSEAFAGLHAENVLMIMDEASAIPDIIWEVAEGALTTPRAMWYAYGNPTRNTGRFRECFGRLKHRWSTHQVDSRTAKMTNKAQIQQWADDYGEDSDFFRVRVKGVFPRVGARQFISSEVVSEAVKRINEVPFGTPKLMGVDVARFGDDASVIARRHGRKLEQLIKYRGLDTMQLASEIAASIRKYKPDVVFVDGVGIGGGVVDRLRQLGFDIVEVNAGVAPENENKETHYNKRSEMWDRMRNWLDTADIPDDRDLIDGLTGIEYGYDMKMRLQLEKKEDMKKRGLASPDEADALSMTFYTSLPPLVQYSEHDLYPDEAFYG